jgi:pSer/pThr/pTyr-binding forkhead associated (FHA) protein
MIVVTVTAPSGDFYSMLFERTSIVIGREAPCDLILQDGNVSTRHARVDLKDGKFIVADTNSTNGIYINGRKVGTPMVVAGPNEIRFAGFVLTISPLRRKP